MKWYNLLNTWTTPVNDMELMESDDGVLGYNDDRCGWLSIKIRCPNFVVAKELRKKLEEQVAYI